MPRRPHSQRTFSDLARSIHTMQEQLEPHRRAIEEIQRQIETSDLTKTVSRVQEQLEPHRRAFEEIQRQMEASNLTKTVSRVQEQLEPHRRAFEELQRQMEASNLTKMLSQMQEQLEPHRRAFEELQRQMEASNLTKTLSQVQEQLEPHRRAFEEIQRQMETSGVTEAVSRWQEQTRLIHEQINLIRLDPNLSVAALHVDHALDLSRRMVRTVQIEMPVPAEPFVDEVSEEQPRSADDQHVRELRDVQHAVLADALAQLFAVVGIDPYYLAIWVETVTSDDVTPDEVREMNLGLIDALNQVISPDSEQDDN